MNIFKENIDELNAVLHVKLEKSDYEKKVADVLNDYKKKARIDGFRPGKVPFGMINKMYRKPVLAEEINKLISESVSDFLINQKLNILGEPLPHLGEEKPIDWDNDTEFEFKFDLGIAPEIEVQITGKDKIPFYLIKTDKDLIDKYIDSYTQRFGQIESVDEATEKDILKASVEQVTSDGNKVEGGITVEEASLSVEFVKDEKIKKQLLSSKKGDRLIIDLKKAYPGDAEIAAILKIEKEKTALIGNSFAVEIKDISRFKKAEVDQDLFDKVFGIGNVKSVIEFKDKITEEAAKGLKMDSEYRFKIDAKDILMKKFKSKLPVDFLKRWLHLVNDGKFTMEQIEQEFEHFVEDLKWQLIKDKIIKDNNISVTDEDMKTGAIDFTRIQLAQYGLSNLPDEQLMEFANRMLGKEEEKNKIKSKVTEDKIFEYVKSIAKVEENQISTEKFNKLFEK